METTTKLEKRNRCLLIILNIAISVKYFLNKYKKNQKRKYTTISFVDKVNTGSRQKAAASRGCFLALQHHT